MQVVAETGKLSNVNRRVYSRYNSDLFFFFLRSIEMIEELKIRGGKSNIQYVRALSEWVRMDPKSRWIQMGSTVDTQSAQMVRWDPHYESGGI